MSLYSGNSLLPTNRTAWENALSLTSAEHRDIDADAIRRAFDPWTCPEGLLPWLAYQFSVDFWIDTWSVSKKRQVIARSVELQFKKGTLAGIEEFIALADAKLLGVTVAPAKVFSGPSLTREQREAWLSRMPQLRVWTIAEPGTAGLKLFSGGYSHPSFVDGRFNQPSDALTRLRRRARYVVDGIETDSTVEENGTTFRVRIKSQSRTKVFSDRVAPGHYFQPSDAAQRLVTIGPRITTPGWRSPVGPSLETVSAEPELIVETGTDRRQVFSGKPTRKRWFQPSQAFRHVFYRYAVFDGSTVTRRTPVQFNGVGRFGFPPHAALLRLSVPGFRSAYAARDGVFVPGSRFWVPHDRARTEQVRRAIRVSMRLSDRILLQFGQRPRFIAGQPFFAGREAYILGRP